MAPLVTARVRHQPGQAVLVVVLAALVSLAGVLGVGYAGAVEESVQAQVLSGAPTNARGMSVAATSADPASPDDLLTALRPALGARVWGDPVAGAQADGLLVHGHDRVLAPVVARQGLCGHLTVARGSCLDRADGTAGPGTGQVLVSRSEADRLGLDVGDRLTLADASQSNEKIVLTLTVAGVYAPYDSTDDFWFDRPTGQAAVAATSVQGGDVLFVDWSTMRSATWRTLTTTVDVPGDPAQMTVEQTAQVRREVTRLDAAAKAAGASSGTQLPALLDQAGASRADARAALPLLALQIVLLALVVLGYVAAATTEQRRAEVALARLRGQQPRAAAGFLMRELGLLIVVGSVLGAVLGWACAVIAARLWLSGPTTGAADTVATVPVGVPLSWTMVAVTLATMVAGLVCAVTVAVPTVREPLVTLLRAVPPRSSALRAGIGDGVVEALCVAGLATLLSGDPGDPTALLAPGLLALAGGLLLSQTVVPVAAAVGRRQLRRGRLRSALAAVAVARRPALRRLVAIVTVSVALLVFAVTAGAVAGDQRRVEAARRVGAPVVLTVQAENPSILRRAVQTADPTGRYATPVLVGRGAADQGARSMAVDPASFARIALWGRAHEPGRGAPDLGALVPRPVAPVGVTATSIEIAVNLTATPIEPDPDEAAMLGPGWNPATSGLARPLVVTIDLDLTNTDTGTGATGAAGTSPVGYQEVTLGRVGAGRTTLSATVPCRQGCAVRRVRLVRDQSDLGGVGIEASITMRATGTTTDPQRTTAVALNGGDHGWVPVASFAPVEVSGTAQTLVLTSRNFGGDLGAQRTDVPPTLPAIVSGNVPAAPYFGMLNQDPTDLVSAPGPTGETWLYAKVGTLPAVPGASGPVALVSYEPSSHLEAPVGARALQQVWVSADDPGREHALVQRLDQGGVQVLHRDSVAGTERVLTGQGQSLALRLAVLAGVLALVLGTCVLGVAVATSGRIRAYDLAGLRVVGVPRAVVAGAAVREQLVVAAVGVLCGGLLGAAGAALTLSRGDGGSLPAPQVSAGWPAALQAVALSFVVLSLVCWVLGRRLVRRAVPELLTEGAR